MTGCDAGVGGVCSASPHGGGHKGVGQGPRGPEAQQDASAVHGGLQGPDGDVEDDSGLPGRGS